MMMRMVRQIVRARNAISAEKCSNHALLRTSAPAISFFLMKWPIARCYHIADVRNSQNKERSQLKTKHWTRKAEKGCGDCLCVTYATADKYNMDPLVRDVLKDARFSLKDMPVEFYHAANFRTKDQTALANLNFPGEIFVFRDGTVSFWNMSSGVTEMVLKLTRIHAQDIYPAHLVKWESEEMAYSYEEGPTKFQNGRFALSKAASQDDLTFDMFALSNALCASVKLGHWEDSLDSLINSLENIPVNLIKGQRLKYHTPAAVLRKIGQILLIRHRVNLQYNLLDIPDAYWDREDLEKLYLNTARFLNISGRVHLMNEKLTYCAHMAELLKTDLHEKRSLRVELLIVLLISIEVVFEVIHLFVLPYMNDADSQAEDDDGG